LRSFEENENALDAIQCFAHPAQNNDDFDFDFNQQFDYQIDSTMIAPLIFSNDQHVEADLIGFIQLINGTFTINEKQTLFPLTEVIAIGLKLLHHLSPSNKIFSAINGCNENESEQQDEDVTLRKLLFKTRVRRGISRSHRGEIKPQSHSLSTEDHNIINVDNRHRSISHAASPIFHDNMSTTSSISSQPTPIFAPMVNANAPLSPLLSMKRNRKRNESEHFHLQPDELDGQHQLNSIVVDAIDFKKEQQKLKDEHDRIRQHKSRRSISCESPSQSSTVHRKHPSTNNQLLRPPTPMSNV